MTRLPDPPARPRPSLDPDRLLKLDLPAEHPLGRRLAGRAVAAAERLLGLDDINAVYDRTGRRDTAAVGLASDASAATPASPAAASFARRVLADLGVTVDVAAEDLARIPKSGPFMAVANHPFGAVDGLTLLAVLADARPDVRVLANHLLGRVPELRDLLVLVDPFGGAAATAANARPMRQCLRHLADGRPLAAFPAGEVSHLRLGGLLRGEHRRRGEPAVADPAWSPVVARLARRASVPALPVYFDGRNGPLFQAAGLLHPRLRTALLGRALLAMRGARVTLRIGSLVPAKRLGGFDSDAAATDYLRRRTYLLRHGVPRPSRSAAATADAMPHIITAGSTTPASAPPASVADRLAGGLRRAAARLPAGVGRRLAAAAAVPAEPIIPAVDPAAMAAEIDALPPGSLLLEQDGLAVFHARAPQIRQLLREIGRLREVTFRLVGEGTGKAVDLDTFDYDYGHLFIWNRAAREVVGAYRLGQTDLLLPAKGRQGLYTSTLFNYRAVLLARLGPALEMGRSFVRPEYQRHYAPLLLLWKGIGHFLVRHPRYRYLFGPVSISNRYQTVSRQLMVEFLKLHHAMPGGEALAKPKNPFKPGRRAALFGAGRWDDPGVRALLADEEVSTLVADLEPDHKGIPVLVRQYLKLGAKFLAFNVDRDFGGCLDGLIVVDLLHTEARVLERYMTKPGYAGFVGHHKGDNLKAPAPAAATDRIGETVAT